MKFPIISAAAAIALSVSATATPITTLPPQPVGAGGDVNAVFVFSNADDLDVSWKSAPPPPQLMFCNHTQGTCPAAAAGDTVGFGVVGNGVPLVFQLNDNSPGEVATYFSNATDSVDHDYHAWITQNYSDFGLGAVPTAAANAIAGFTGAVWYVGWEDRRNFDYDYNDLVFALVISQPQHNPGIPEPLTLSLVGMGLLGAFGLRRVKKT